jgi:hypothetical protein
LTKLTRNEHGTNTERTRKQHDMEFTRNEHGMLTEWTRKRTRNPEPGTRHPAP